MRLVYDNEKLVFLPIKHPQLDVCANLAWIECYPGQAYGITSLDASFLVGLTDLEIMILYKHTTGESPVFHGQRLKNILLEIAHRIPVRECNEAEVDRQAAQVPDLRSERYLYNPGQPKPAIQGNLFTLTGLKFPKRPNEKEIAAAAPHYAPTTLPRVPATTLAPSSHAGQCGPSTPRQQGVAGVIWAAADSHWESAGKPKDEKVLLALRRKIMDDLEVNHGAKRVTSSNELGRWMKTKI